jgi:hypothetical protein
LTLRHTGTYNRHTNPKIVREGEIIMKVNKTWLRQIIWEILDKLATVLEEAQKHHLILDHRHSYTPSEDLFDDWVFIRLQGLFADRKPLISIRCGTEEDEGLVVIFHSTKAKADFVSKVYNIVEDFVREHPELSIRAEEEQK